MSFVRSDENVKKFSTNHNDLMTRMTRLMLSASVLEYLNFCTIIQNSVRHWATIKRSPDGEDEMRGGREGKYFNITGMQEPQFLNQ